MNRVSRIDAELEEIGRWEVHQQLYQNPLKWIGKWMLGKGVYLAYLALHLALYIWYHYIFLPWRDK
jgi:hypothetical protein